ncbi:MAG: hypothetical protein ACRCTQ_02645 [Brevinemataceae bacterium]
MRKFLFCLLTFISSYNLYADDDFMFVSPSYNQQITNPLVIQIAPAYMYKNVKVWLKRKSEFIDWTVWRGKLTKKNNYTLLVNISKFKPGLYELKAKYYLYGEDYESEMDIWIDPFQNPPPPIPYN